MTKEINILLIEDNPGDVVLLKEILKESQEIAFQLTSKETLKEGLEELKINNYNIILLDLSLPDSKGINTLLKIKKENIYKPIIILTGNDDYEIAKKAIHEGAQDYLIKGRTENDLLTRAITYAIEREEMEKKLRNSEKLYRELIELSPNAICIFSKKEIVYVNSAAAKLVGANNKKEMIGRNIMDFVYASSQDSVLSKIKKIESGQTGEMTEEKFVKIDGSIIDVEVLSATVKTGIEKTFQIIITDITEKKKLKDSLIQNEEKYRSLYENAAIGIFHSLPEGGFLDVNLALAEMLGYSSPEEIVTVVTNIKNQLYIHPNKRDEIVKNMLEKDEWIFSISEYKRKDGSIMIGNLAARKKLNKNGEFEYFEGLLQDVTDKQKAEEALERQSLLNAEMADLAKQLLSSGSLEDITVITLKKAKQLTGSRYGYVGYIDSATGSLISPAYTPEVFYNENTKDGNPIVINKFNGLCGWTLLHKKSLMTNDVSGDPRAVGAPNGHLKINKFMTAPAMHSEILVGQIAIGEPDDDYTTNDLLAIENLASVYALGVRRMQAVAEVIENQEKFRLAFKYSNVGAVIFGLDRKFIQVNSTFACMLGYSEEELIEKTFRDISHPDDINIGVEEYNKMITGADDSSSFEKRYIHKNGGVIIAFTITTLLRDSKNNPLYFITHIQDFTKRKEAEDTIKASLKEKEALIREIYHRTKNNMQVICAMLGLKALSIQDKKTKSILKEMQNRIQTMALVHQKLYQSKNLSKVDLKEYISDLAELLVKSYNVSSEKVSLKLDLESISVLIDTAVPCGLLINEIVSNSFKYAFPGDRKGQIEISIKRTNADFLELKVSDNGVGVKQDLFSLQEESLGLKLLSAIAEDQLQGELKCDTENGVAYEITFRDVLYSERI
jgi:PAS domain S-box-containing protein